MAHLGKRNGHLVKNTDGHLAFDCCRKKKYYAVFDPGNIYDIFQKHPLCEDVDLPACYGAYDIDEFSPYVRDHIVGGPYETKAECETERLEIWTSPPDVITVTVSGVEDNTPGPMCSNYSIVNGSYTFPWRRNCNWNYPDGIYHDGLDYNAQSDSGHDGFWYVIVRPPDPPELYAGLISFKKYGSFFDGGHTGVYVLDTPPLCDVGSPIAVVS